jgi:hypothetical protein
MPKSPVAAKVIKGTMPTSTYARTLAPLVRGKGSNKTQQYLDGMDANDPGQQGFWREALTDIPHPLEQGRQVSYGGLQQLLNSNQRGAALDAYAQQAKLPKVTAAQMQQALFEQGKARLLERAAANPGQYAFPPAADSARRAPTTAQNIAHGNFAAAVGGEVTNAAVQAQRYADLSAAAPVMAAPGMAVRLVRGAVQPAPTPVRLIHGTIASR